MQLLFLSTRKTRIILQGTTDLSAWHQQSARPLKLSWKTKSWLIMSVMTCWVPTSMAFILDNLVWPNFWKLWISGHRQLKMDSHWKPYNLTSVKISLLSIMDVLSKGYSTTDWPMVYTTTFFILLKPGLEGSFVPRRWFWHHQAHEANCSWDIASGNFARSCRKSIFEGFYLKIYWR